MVRVLPPARGLAAAAGVIAATRLSWAQERVLPTSGGAEAALVADFSVLPLASFSVRIGHFDATSSRLRDGLTQLQFVTPIGCGTIQPVSIVQSTNVSPILAELFHGAVNASFAPPLVTSVVPRSGLTVEGGFTVTVFGTSFCPPEAHAANDKTQRSLSMAPQIRGSSFSEVANPINRIKE